MTKDLRQRAIQVRLSIFGLTDMGGEECSWGRVDKLVDKAIMGGIESERLEVLREVREQLKLVEAEILERDKDDLIAFGDIELILKELEGGA